MFEWTNLFWVCKNCNSSKLNFDTQNNPFIHPENDKPEEYLVYDNLYRIKANMGSDNPQKAQNLIDRTGLRRAMRTSEWFAVIMTELDSTLAELYSLFQEFLKKKTTRAKMMRLSKMLLILKDLKDFAKDDVAYAGRRRFALRNNQDLSAVVKVVNDNLSQLGLSSPFQWEW